MKNNVVSFQFQRNPAVIRALFLLGLLLISCNTAIAQEAIVLSGYIRDARSGETLIQANVYIIETYQGTVTNTSGYYTLPDLRPGTYTFAVSYIGYQTFRQQITVVEGDKKRLDIELQPKIIQGQTIVVEADSQMSIEEEKTIGALTVTPALIREMPAVLEADLFRSLQLLPGVKAASDFSSGLYIRGGSPDQTLILLDRTVVYNPTHFFGFYSTFNTDAIKDVQVYKGAYPAEYGGRLGSVLDIYNRDGNRKALDGSASIGMLAARANLEGPLPKGSWMFSLRRSTLEPLLAVLRKKEENIPESFYFLDLNGKLNYDPGLNDQLHFSFYSGTDKVNFPLADDFSIKLRYGNRTFSSNWTHIFSQKLFSNFTLTASRYFNYPEFEIGGTAFERINEINDYSAKGDFEYIASNQHKSQIGFWTGDLTLTLKDRFNKQENFSSKIDAQYTSAYAKHTWRPDTRWIFTGGLRTDYMNAGDYWRLGPNISLEHVYTQQLLFQAAYGRYYQFLSLITNESFSGFDVWLTTDNGVAPAWGDQLVLGVKTRPSEYYDIDLELYYRTMKSLFELNPRIQDPAGLAYADIFRFGEGFAYGAELLLKKKKGRLNGFIGYTLGVSRRKFPGFNNNKFYPPKYDRIHDLNLVMNYRLSAKWIFNSVFNYATGQAVTKIQGYYRIKTPIGSSSRTALIVNSVNGSRLPAYHRLDIGFTRTGRFFDMGDYKLQLQLINAYSRRNVWFYAYEFDEASLKEETVNMLPLLPNISLTVDF